MHINDLPVELHICILDFACSSEWTITSDEYPVAHALAQVSSYWETISRPYRFYTLRVMRLTSINKLLRLLPKVGSNYRHPHHLSLVFSESTPPLSDDLTNWEGNLIIELLVLTTPTLISLSIDLTKFSYSTLIFAKLWSLRSPCLRILSISGLYPFPAQPSETLKPNFPVLEKLTLGGVSNPHGLFSTCNLAIIFPRLSELGVHVSCTSVSFAKEVRSSLNNKNPGLKCNQYTNQTSFIPKMPGRITLYIVECGNLTKRNRLLRKEMEAVLSDFVIHTGDKKYFLYVCTSQTNSTTYSQLI